MANMQGKTISCSAVVVKEFQKPVTIETIEVYPPQEKEVRVKIAAAGVCHTDKCMQSGKYPDQLLPFVLGHEGAGIVESVGENVESVEPGDKVIISTVPNCQKCKSCKGTRTNTCDDCWGNKNNLLSRYYGYDGQPRFSFQGKPLYHLLGTSAFSEYVVIPETSCVKINATAPLEKVCILACGFSTGYGAATKAVDILPGDCVAIWGLGGVGLAAVVGAKSKGAVKIIGIDINNDKEAIARKMGITDFVNIKQLSKPLHETIHEMTAGGSDFALVCTSNTQSMETAVMCTNNGGTTVIVGYGDDTPIKVIPSTIIFNRKIKGTILGDYKIKEDLPKLVDTYLNGKLPLDDFITHTFKLEQIEEAFELLDNGKCIRSVIHM